MYFVDKYYLMHKDIVVAKFEMTNYGTDIKVEEIYDATHMPYGTHVAFEKINEKMTEWKKGRSVPTTRPFTRLVYKKAQKSIPEIEVENYGLSLFDTYWYKPTNSDLTWDKVNFFRNEFSNIGNIFTLNENG